MAALPVVGTPVWYYQPEGTAAIAVRASGPLAAIVVETDAADARVSLVVFDRHGNAWSRQDVAYVEPGQPCPKVLGHPVQFATVVGHDLETV